MVRIVRPERVSGEAAAAEGIRAKARDDIHANLRLAEAHMTGREWWLDHWSVADAYLYYIVNAVQRRGVSAEDCPALLAHSRADGGASGGPPHAGLGGAGQRDARRLTVREPNALSRTARPGRAQGR